MRLYIDLLLRYCCFCYCLRETLRPTGSSNGPPNFFGKHLARNAFEDSLKGQDCGTVRAYPYGRTRVEGCGSLTHYLTYLTCAFCFPLSLSLCLSLFFSRRV